MATFHREKRPPDGKAPGWYKDCLRMDFQCRCAYCLIHERDNTTHENFQVDHFKPRSLFKSLERVYSNLYYSCTLCNKPGRKSNHWPTEKETSQGLRFVDPCAEDWESHIVFLRTGMVEANTEPGRYSIGVLGLNRPYLIGIRLKCPAEYYARSLVHKMDGQLSRIGKVISNMHYHELAESVRELQANLRELRKKIEEKWNEKKPTDPQPVCPF